MHFQLPRALAGAQSRASHRSQVAVPPTGRSTPGFKVSVYSQPGDPVLWQAPTHEEAIQTLHSQAHFSTPHSAAPQSSHIRAPRLQGQEPQYRLYEASSPSV
ncbi:hypothetical protein NDU88_001229 [Pleurodeles waltl]|uniref:Uncharacterized protein n=1 Tax=Pleurodeles waltl TaxID=8319 RepID=A0AAV7TJ43_PLEWA|nr:hypothetical protein NDU88_001229 [Pleurodeles waltl]